MDSAFAQTVVPAAAPAASVSDSFFSIPGMILSLAVAYFIIYVLPQNKERKKREEALKNIQRGDRVLTRGGIYGTVADIKENVLVLKVNESSKVEVDRSYVDSVEKAS
jgi:preprotein translocase subunit YajC